MKTKTVKEKLAKLIRESLEAEGYSLSSDDWKPTVDKIDKLYRKEMKGEYNRGWVEAEDFIDSHSRKTLPPMILDDDIADWEHDNLVKNG